MAKSRLIVPSLLFSAAVMLAACGNSPSNGNQGGKDGGGHGGSSTPGGTGGIAGGNGTRDAGYTDVAVGSDTGTVRDASSLDSLDGGEGGGGGALPQQCLTSFVNPFAALTPYWANWSNSTCGSAVASNGNLVLTQNEPCGTASPDVIEGLAQPYVLCGDFDVQVGYALTGFGAAPVGGMFASLRVDDPAAPLTGMTVERYVASYLPSSNSYQNYKSYTDNSGNDATSVILATSDTTGRLRITRSGTTVTSYYWKVGTTDAGTGQWVLVKTAVLTSTPWVVLLYAGDNSTVGAGPAASYSVTFSNLQVTSPGATDAGTGNGPLADAGASDAPDTAVAADANAVDAPGGSTPVDAGSTSVDGAGTPDGPGGSGANLLINGSFEANQLTAADSCGGFAWCERSFSSTPGWTQILDGVDLINNNYQQGSVAVLVHASDGVNYLDMNQAGDLGGLYQVVAATPGASYTLTLDTCAWAQNSIPGTIGYELYDPASSAVLDSGSFTDSVGGTWVTRTLTAVAISSSIGVRIQGLAAHQAGMGLDNVVLVPGGLGRTDGGGSSGTTEATMFLPSNGGATVDRYGITANADPVLSATLSAASPTGMALRSTGELFVADNSGGTISRFLSPLSTPMANGTITGVGLSAPQEMRFVDDELWIVNPGASNVVRLAFDTQGSASLAGTVGGSTLVGGRGMLWNAATRDLYVSLYSTNTIQHFRVASDHTVTSLTPITGNGLSTPHGMAITSWGELLVANGGGTSLSRFTIDALGNATPNGSIQGNGIATPIGLAVAPWGELFVANNGGVVSRFSFTLDSSHAAWPQGTFKTATSLGWILIVPSASTRLSGDGGLAI